MLKPHKFPFRMVRTLSAASMLLIRQMGVAP